jgi:hypothetical protein
VDFCVLDSEFTRMNKFLQLASDFLDRDFFSKLSNRGRSMN